MTTTYDDLAMPTLESSRELFCEADKFNDLYGTHYTQENLEKFDKYFLFQISLRYQGMNSFPLVIKVKG